jgi:hypothetical protein
MRRHRHRRAPSVRSVRSGRVMPVGAYVVRFAAYSVTNVAVWLSLVASIGLAVLIVRALYGPPVFGASPWAPP